MIGEGSSSYKEISSGQSSLSRSGLSLFHKTRNNCTVRHQCKTDTRGIRPARLMPYSKKINLIRPWHCVIALGPAGLFITFSQTQHFWSTCQSVAKMLLALDLCCQGQEGLLPSAHAFVLGMQFPLSAHKVHFFSTVFLSVCLEWKSSYKPWHMQISNTCFLSCIYRIITGFCSFPPCCGLFLTLFLHIWPPYVGL